MKNKTKSNFRVTLDTLHQKKINEFESQKKKLPQMEKNLENILKKIRKIESQKTKKNIQEYFKLLEKKEVLEKKITDIKTEKSKKDYYLDVSQLLFEYYEKKKNPVVKQANFNTNHNSNSIINFFNPEQSTKSQDNDDQPKQLCKKDIYKKYLEKIDKDYVSPMEYNQHFEQCKECNTDMVVIQSEGIMRCMNCGLQENILIDSDKPSYKDPPREMSYFSYKRINHFNEWLAQWQAKESTEIPKEVFDQIFVEIKKYRIKNMATLTKAKLRKILKKLKLNKYYEHVPHIINRLIGVSAPVISPEMEEKLRMMFKKIQAPFLKHCPKNRKNFLSYSYVLHKFVELIGMHEYKKHFPLLKSREKLHAQDMIWKNICMELNWSFHKSL